MVKVKGVFWTLVVVVVVWAAASVLIPDEILPPSNKRNDGRLLELKVTFVPSPRINEVQIGYSVGGGAIKDDPTRDSPWVKRISVARGTGVMLFAKQSDISLLECGIYEVTPTGLVSLIWDVAAPGDPYPETVVCEVRG